MLGQLKSSVSASSEVLGHALDEVIAVAGILELAIGHGGGLVPASDDDALGSSDGAGTTAALSSEVDGVVLGVVLDEHVLLVGDSDAGLSALAVALGSLEDTLELVDGDLLLGAVLLGELELVGIEGVPGGLGPLVAVVAVDGGELAHVGQGVLLSGSVVSVTDLVEICVPA